MNVHLALGPLVSLIAGILHGREERDRTLLIGETLAVRERQVDEAAAHWWKLAIEAARDGVPRRAPRRRVAHIGARRIAEEIARELVEQENEGEISIARGQPVVVCPRRGALVIGEEAAAGAVEFRVAPEPEGAFAVVLRRAGRAKPEFEEHADPRRLGRAQRRLRG